MQTTVFRSHQIFFMAHENKMYLRLLLPFYSTLCTQQDHNVQSTNCCFLLPKIKYHTSVAMKEPTFKDKYNLISGVINAFSIFLGTEFIK
jgi:hypothetical protein